MKVLVTLVLTLAFSAFLLGQKPNEGSSNNSITNGVGWGVITVNSDRAAVEKKLGKGEGSEGSEYLDWVYFREYPEMGIQVSYTNKGNKVVAIFFYNKQYRY